MSYNKNREPRSGDVGVWNGEEWVSQQMLPSLLAQEGANTGDIIVWNGTSWVPTDRQKEQVKSITIESPTASEDIPLWYAVQALTITRIDAVCRGTSPSVTWTIRHSSDRSAAGNEVVTGGSTTTSTTTGNSVLSFNDATIPAGSWIWLETTATSGTISDIVISIQYTRD